jgi:hypothetical protein
VVTARPRRTPLRHPRETRRARAAAIRGATFSSSSSAVEAYGQSDEHLDNAAVAVIHEKDAQALVVADQRDLLKSFLVDSREFPAKIFL